MAKETIGDKDKGIDDFFASYGDEQSSNVVDDIHPLINSISSDVSQILPNIEGLKKYKIITRAEGADSFPGGQSALDKKLSQCELEESYEEFCEKIGISSKETNAITLQHVKGAEGTHESDIAFDAYVQADGYLQIGSWYKDSLSNTRIILDAENETYEIRQVFNHEVLGHHLTIMGCPNNEFIREGVAVVIEAIATEMSDRDTLERASLGSVQCVLGNENQGFNIGNNRRYQRDGIFRSAAIREAGKALASALGISYPAQKLSEEDIQKVKRLILCCRECEKNGLTSEKDWYEKMDTYFPNFSHAFKKASSVGKPVVGKNMRLYGMQDGNGFAVYAWETVDFNEKNMGRSKKPFSEIEEKVSIGRISLDDFHLSPVVAIPLSFRFEIHKPDGSLFTSATAMNGELSVTERIIRNSVIKANAALQTGNYRVKIFDEFNNDLKADQIVTVHEIH